MSQARRSTRKKRQTQLSFSPLPSSSPAASSYPEQIQRRAAAVRYEGDTSSPTKKQRVQEPSHYSITSSPASADGNSMFGRQKLWVVVDSPSKKQTQLPTPAASSQPRMDEDLFSDTVNNSSQSDKLSSRNYGVNLAGPIARGTTRMESGIGTMDLSNEEELPVSSVRRTRPARVTMSGDDEPVTPKKRLRVPPKSHTDTNTSVGPGTRRLQRKPRSNLSKSPRSPKSADLESGGSNTGLSNTKTALDEFPNAKIPVVISDGSERSSSEEDLIISPIRRRRKPAELRSRSQEVQPEKHTSVNLQAEVEDLQDSDNAIRRIRTRGPQDTSARSIRQQKLEELRRRRAGIQEESESEDESPSDEEYPSGPEPIHHAMRRGGNLDEYENDFLDDEDDTVGVDLGVAGVPLEFTYHANKKPFEHFKTEIEWMVHNKLNPAFDRRDEIYELAHKKLDDEVQGYAGSKFSSSVWNVEFMTALRNRPDISRIDVPTMLEHKCDACNRSNHPPKHRVTFSGKRYNRETLEAIEDADDSSSNDDETSSSSDDEQDYFLGRFCCANAEMSHALHHWRYALNESVLDWLAADGHLTPEKILERENLRRKKREKLANRIVDGMETRGVMKVLYKQFKENLAAARDAKPQRFSDGH